LELTVLTTWTIQNLERFVQWVLSGIAEAGLTLSIFGVSMISNDWAATLTVRKPDIEKG
jgi:hypothetical protein